MPRIEMSDWNLPPGCSTNDIDELFSEEEEMPDQEQNDPTLCRCGDPWCHGCPSDEEFEAERDSDGRIEVPGWPPTSEEQERFAQLMAEPNVF